MGAHGFVMSSDIKRGALVMKGVAPAIEKKKKKKKKDKEKEGELGIVVEPEISGSNKKAKPTYEHLTEFEKKRKIEMDKRKRKEIKERAALPATKLHHKRGIDWQSENCPDAGWLS